MRILVDKEDVEWDKAWEITVNSTCATPTTRCCPKRWSAGR